MTANIYTREMQILMRNGWPLDEALEHVRRVAEQAAEAARRRRDEQIRLQARETAA